MLVCLAVTLWTLPAQAMTAEELAGACQKVDVITASRSASDLAPFEFMAIYATAQHCLGFVDGFMSAASVAQAINLKAMPFCQPKEGISIDQARRIFLKYIAAHPEDLHSTAQLILAVALREAFPCDRP